MNHNDLLCYSVREQLIHSVGVAYHSKADLNVFHLGLDHCRMDKARMANTWQFRTYWGDADQMADYIYTSMGATSYFSPTGSSVAGFPPHPVSLPSLIVLGIVLSRINGTTHPTAMLVDNNTLTICSISLTPTTKKRGHWNSIEGNMCLR